MSIDGPIEQIHQRLRRARLALVALGALNLTLISWSVAGALSLGAAWAVSLGWRGDGALLLLSGSAYLALCAPLLCLSAVGWRLRRRHDVAARLEARDAQLNDALLTALEAESNPRLGAPQVVQALQRRVSQQLNETRLSAWAPWGLARRGGVAILVTLSAWLVGFSVRGAELYGVFKVAQESPELISQRLAYTPLIGDIKLTITPPDYTGAPPRYLEGGSGDFEALEGSVVTIEATLSRRASDAQLWIKRGRSTATSGEEATSEVQSSAQTSQTFEREGRFVRGSFQVDESFEWSVSLTDLEGVEWREAAHRQVIARPDRPPQISVITPTTGERVDPQKDLKVSLRGKDDYGLSEVSILIALDSDMEHPESLQLNGVGGAEWSGADSIDLRVVEAQGGDRIALWARALDSRALDEERGPQAATSAIVYLEIDSPEWEHRKLLDALREHLEAQLEALAGRLEVGYVKPEDPSQAPKALGVADLLGRWVTARQASDRARDGFDALLKRVAEDELTPEEIHLALVSKLVQLDSALERESEDMNGMTRSARSESDQAQETLKQIERHSAPVERAHEEIVILIEAMVARMALEEMANLADELKASRAKIRELMKMYRDQPSEALKSRIRRELQRFRQKMRAMREMMEKLQKKLPKEFLNLDGMKSDEVTKSLEESESQVSSIEQLLEEGKLDEAMEELDKLSESLEEMAQQLQKDMDELHRQTNPELEQALSELMDSTRDLMKAQEEVQRDTQAQQAAMDEAVEEERRAQEQQITALIEKAKRIVELERGAELNRQGRYVERIREDARKAGDDLKRSLEQLMLDESLDAAERSGRYLRSLKRLTEPRRRRGQLKPSASTRALQEASELSDEVAESLRDLREAIAERARRAREEAARAQDEARAQREAQARADAQQSRQPGQPQPGQEGQPQSGQEGQPQSGQSGQRSGQSGSPQMGRSGQPSRGQRSRRGQQRRSSGDPGAGLAQRQSKITRGLERLQSQLEARREKIPSLHQVPTEPFERAQRASQDASSQLRDHQPGRGLEGQQQVSESLKQVMEGLQQAKKPQRGQKPGQEQSGQQRPGRRGNSSTERVELPKQGERGPDALRKDLLDAMKSKPARGYDDQVKAYYDSLVR